MIDPTLDRVLSTPDTPYNLYIDPRDGDMQDIDFGVYDGTTKKLLDPMCIFHFIYLESNHTNHNRL